MGSVYKRCKLFDFHSLQWHVKDFLGSASLVIDSNKVTFNHSTSVTLKLENTTTGTLTIRYNLMRPIPVPSTSTSQPPKHIPNESLFHEYEFSPEFIPCVPSEFKLLNSKKDSHDKIWRAEFQGPVGPHHEECIVQVSIHDLKSLKFEQVRSDYVNSYISTFSHLGSSQFILIHRDKELTPVFEGRYERVMEHLFRTSTSEGLLTVCCVTCLLVERNKMASFFFHTYGWSQDVYVNLLDIVASSTLH